MDDKPLVSVCIITYNHAQYIEQAIESVLNQKVDFSWECIIADDCSSDGSQDFIAGYYKQHPNFIRVIQQQKNVGPSANWHQLVGAARGKYIAYLEGDDYWNDTHKLKKQITVLGAHPEYAGCFHNTEERFEGDTKASTLYCRFPTERAISFADLTSGN